MDGVVSQRYTGCPTKGTNFELEYLKDGWTKLKIILTETKLIYIFIITLAWEMEYQSLGMILGFQDFVSFS